MQIQGAQKHMQPLEEKGLKIKCLIISKGNCHHLKNNLMNIYITKGYNLSRMSEN